METLRQIVVVIFVVSMLYAGGWEVFRGVFVKKRFKEYENGLTAAVVMGYGTGSVGAALKGAMQNSKSQYVRALSKTNVAGTVVAVTVSATKTFARYFNGEIDGVECLETLGEQGTGMLSSAMFAAISQIAVPKFVISGLIGGWQAMYLPLLHIVLY